ncbi:MAG: universal stress protein [Alcanivoracaceae bacterium]|jgi:nucleotide-binding universal stress UspA family protein|nr:universal stress protein [Alcanivoracaceae bacterium]
MSHILACIDGSSAAIPVCDYAAWAARRLGAPLTLLHVLDEARFPVESDLSGNLGVDAREHLLNELADIDAQRNKLALRQGELMLEAARERVIADGIAEPVLRQRHGHLVDTLSGLEADTHLLVMGKQGEAHTDAHAVGDNVEKVIRALHRPILLAAGEFREPQEVMLAFDNSDISRRGIQMLCDSPLFSTLTCHLVSVGDDSALQTQLDEAEKRLAASGHAVKTAVLAGEIEPALHRYQQDNNIDMVLMGAYGHSRLREWLLGSTTNDMIRHATVPHLLLR